MKLTFKERKEDRAEYYFRFVYGWRQRPCGACSGSGRYDHNGSPKCGGCDGTGKEIYRGPKARSCALNQGA
jgi:DnaJ-class molecular chaperone